MPVLDYMRYTERTVEGRPYLIVPPFHTGALGFIPDTEVFVHLPRSASLKQQATHCELYVTPFDGPTGYMARVNVLLLDRPGVVQRLIAAIARLGVNIVKQESNTINNHRHHHVEMVIDWSTSQYKNPGPSTLSEQHLYRDLHPRLPIADNRYVRLYEAIVSECIDVLEFDRAYGTLLPSIHVEPFSHRQMDMWDKTVLWSAEKYLKSGQESSPEAQSSPNGLPGAPKFHVVIELSDNQFDLIESQTGYRDEPIGYLLSSDGNTRTLRVYFIAKSRLHQVVHIAFRHLDRPGALNVLAQLVGAARFDILTSLLRKNNKRQCTWELHLEYLGEDSPPPLRPSYSYGRRATLLERRDYRNAMLDWFHTRITSSGELDILRHDLENYQVAIVAPAYPKLTDKAISLLPTSNPDAARSSPPTAGRSPRDKGNALVPVPVRYLGDERGTRDIVVGRMSVDGRLILGRASFSRIRRVPAITHIT